MAMHDGNSRYKPVSHIIAGAATSTQTPSSGVDTKGFEEVTVLIAIGTITDIANSPYGHWTFKLQESDSESADFSDITDSNQVLIDSSKSPVTAPDSSTGVFLTVNAASEDDTVYSVGVLSTKRYIRCVATAVDTPGATPIAVTVLLSDAAQLPTSH